MLWLHLRDPECNSQRSMKPFQKLKQPLNPEPSKFIRNWTPLNPMTKNSFWRKYSMPPLIESFNTFTLICQLNLKAAITPAFICSCGKSKRQLKLQWINELQLLLNFLMKPRILIPFYQAPRVLPKKSAITSQSSRKFPFSQRFASSLKISKYIMFLHLNLW